MQKTVLFGDFGGFHLYDRVHFDLFQFVDDTILIEEGSWNNIWSIKVVLRGIEFVSSLQVNLSKS